MRELKFRSWKMHYGKLRRCVFSPFGLVEYVQMHPEAPVLHNEDVNDIRDFMPNADVIEQYTGLKDKNGKEIYEGDIIVCNNAGGCIGVVEYDAPEYYIKIDAETWAPLVETSRQIVIGNIHELNMEELCQKE